jgi:hypothetical protein
VRAAWLNTTHPNFLTDEDIASLSGSNAARLVAQSERLLSRLKP